MPQPHVILTSTSSLDGRTDLERPDLLQNRLEEYRIQELRGEVDAIVTSTERIEAEGSEFPVKGTPKKEAAIVVVDKKAELSPEAAILKDMSKKVVLVTCRKVNKNRVKRISSKRPDIEVMELGEFAVNLEDMVWELHRQGLRRILLEGDIALNMRMLDHGLVNEVYVMVAPVLLGQQYATVFDGKLESQQHLQLEGILQYGDHVVLHYLVQKH